MLAPRRILGRSEPWVFAAIVALGLLIQARSGQFFTGNNLVDLVRALVVPALLSVGCMMVMVSGGIDVSFTAIASLAMYVTDKSFSPRATPAMSCSPMRWPPASAFLWGPSTAS